MCKAEIEIEAIRSCVTCCLWEQQVVWCLWPKSSCGGDFIFHSDRQWSSPQRIGLFHRSYVHSVHINSLTFFIQHNVGHFKCLLLYFAAKLWPVRPSPSPFTYALRLSSTYHCDYVCKVLSWLVNFWQSLTDGCQSARSVKIQMWSLIQTFNTVQGPTKDMWVS